MATRKPKRFSSGSLTEDADKEAGLAASKGYKVGFFERLRMGNIDDEKSEAYNRFGAGRAKADRDMASEAAAMKAVDEYRAPKPATRSAAPSPAVVEDELEAANKREPIQVSAGPRAEPAKSTSKTTSKPASSPAPKPTPKPAKEDSKKEMTEAEAKKQLKLGERPSAAEVSKAKAQLNLGNSDRNENYGNEGRGRAKTSPKVEKADKPSVYVNKENKDATNETFKKGGSVRSASSRADGIAVRGKTRA
jgi:hypothetical protein